MPEAKTWKQKPTGVTSREWAADSMAGVVTGDSPRPPSPETALTDEALESMLEESRRLEAEQAAIQQKIASRKQIEAEQSRRAKFAQLEANRKAAIEQSQADVETARQIVKDLRKIIYDIAEMLPAARLMLHTLDQTLHTAQRRVEGHSGAYFLATSPGQNPTGLSITSPAGRWREDWQAIGGNGDGLKILTPDAPPDSETVIRAISYDPQTNTQPVVFRR